MQVFVALCIVAFVAVAQGAGLTPEQIAKLKTNKQACLTSTGADEALVTKVRNLEAVDDAKVYKFFDCMFKASNFINDDGVIQIDVVKSKVPSEISAEAVDALVATCEKVKTTPKERKAYEAYRCFKTETHGKLELIPQTA